MAISIISMRPRFKIKVSIVQNNSLNPSLPSIEVRDSRTGYLIPARDGAGALPDMDSSWDAVAAAAAVSRKMPKYEEMHTFSKLGMSEISRNDNLSEIKAPAGAS